MLYLGINISPHNPDKETLDLKRITLDRGVKVRTFSPPSLSFDPLSASAAELHRHGFPARPDHPQHLERYEQVFGHMKNRFHYIEPTFRVNSKRRLPFRSPIIGTGNEFNPFWSGGGVLPPTGQSFRWMLGEWTVPNVRAPTNDGQTYYCTSWVGIDGNTDFAQSQDLCQAGINLEVTQSGSSIARNATAWFEWFPGPEVEIPNFPVAFGDTVIITLCTTGAGATEALVFFANLTRGAGTSLVFEAPMVEGQQISLVGDCAQWVVERPASGEKLNPALLADYVELFFSGCQAVSYSADGSSSEVVDGGTQFRIDMVEDTNILSHGILVADTVIQCVYVAPGTGIY